MIKKYSHWLFYQSIDFQLFLFNLTKLTSTRRQNNLKDEFILLKQMLNIAPKLVFKFYKCNQYANILNLILLKTTSFHNLSGV